MYPEIPVLGAALHWMDHGKLEIVVTVGINV